MKVGPIKWIERINCEQAIYDAERLLWYHDRVTRRRPGPPSKAVEVLKRCAVIMLVTSWETYVEDALRRRVLMLLRSYKTGGPTNNQSRTIADIVVDQLNEDLRKLNTPKFDNVRRLYQKYLGIDITQSWQWRRMPIARVKSQLDALVTLRGKLAHRARSTFDDKAAVRRTDVIDGVRLIRKLLHRTDAALDVNKTANNPMELNGSTCRVGCLPRKAANRHAS